MEEPVKSTLLFYFWLTVWYFAFVLNTTISLFSSCSSPKCCCFLLTIKDGSVAPVSRVAYLGSQLSPRAQHGQVAPGGRREGPGLQ